MNRRESSNGLFGGNSNWRGPIWFPINFLLIEALQRFHHYYGEHFTVECPTGSGRFMTPVGRLRAVPAPLSHLPQGRPGTACRVRPAERFQQDPNWSELIPFHEYFNGDTGAGVGASHQTGWTALVAKLLQQSGEFNEGHRSSAGKPGSVHLAELTRPSLFDAGRPRRPRQGAARRRDGTDREINAAEYGQAPAGFDFLVIGHEGFGRVEAVGPGVTFLRPGDYVVATVRRPGHSLYDQIGLQDMTTDDEYSSAGSTCATAT